MKLGRTMTLLPLVGALLAGCGDDTAEMCEEMCEGMAACPAYTTGQDCSGECAQLDTLAASAGCEDDYDEFLDCFVDEDDMCNPSTACLEEVLGYSSCVMSYCTRDPIPAECGGSTGGGDSCSFSSTTSSGGGSFECSMFGTCSDGRQYEVTCADGACSCSADGNTATFHDVPYDEGLCSGGLDAQIAAATAACGWNP